MRLSYFDLHSIPRECAALCAGAAWGDHPGQFGPASMSQILAPNLEDIGGAGERDRTADLADVPDEEIVLVEA